MLPIAPPGKTWLASQGSISKIVIIGFALNVKTDKKYFSLIKPCGLDVSMASINDFFDDDVTVESVRDMLIENIKDVFNFNMQGVGR